jgi:hypothetical protein
LRSRITFPLPLPLPLPPLLGEGERPLEDMAVPAAVSAEAALAVEGALLLRAQSRTRKPIPGPPSGPAQSPRVRGHFGRCGRRETAATT